MLTITIPFKTPTINHMYGFRGYHKFFTKEGKLLRKRIEDICLAAQPATAEYADKKLSIVVEIHENWFCKNGAIKKVDISNREKFLVDSVFNAIGLDDKQIFDHRMMKVQDDKEYSVIRIETAPVNERSI